MSLDRLTQPDERTCGPSCVVAARMLQDAGYADRIGTNGFDPEVLRLHRRLTGWTDVHGRRQVPWPRSLGTPPWAVARGLSTPAVRYRTRIVRGLRAGQLAARLRSELAAGRPIPLYVGSRGLPRHVVLAVDATADGVQIYNPADGTVGRLRPDGLAGLTRWATPWFLVTPARLSASR